MAAHQGSTRVVGPAAHPGLVMPAINPAMANSSGLSTGMVVIGLGSPTVWSAIRLVPACRAVHGFTVVEAVMG